MSRKRPDIPRRKRVFVGCEGASEASYCRLLGRLAEGPPRVHIHLEPHILQPGAGDPLELVRTAIDKVRFEENRRSAYAVKAMLIDRGSVEKCAAAQSLAALEQIQIIWQYPDHEAFLLRHLPNCQQKRPPAGASMVALRREWPTYIKALPMMGLAQKIALADVMAAAGVDEGLRKFLRSIGFDVTG